MSEVDIKILIVEPPSQAPNLLMRIVESDDHIRVLGVVESAAEALKFVSRNRPDLITIDLGLPGLDGLSFTREIMQSNPIPIVVVGSSVESMEDTRAFDILEAGALAAVAKPVAGLDKDDEFTRNLIETIKTMAEIKLVRRMRHRQGKSASPSSVVNDSATLNGPIDLVAIGASTGGPGVIQQVLKQLPADFPAPIVIAQHIAPGFTNALVHWLATTSGFTVKVCCNNDKLEPGVAYLCPEGLQTGLSSSMRVKLSEDDSHHGIKPSVSYLFSSLAEMQGKRIVAVLLTGMGRDGAEEMKLIRERGGVTIVQDAETSLVHGMPGEAIKLGAAQHVLSASKISELLVELACAKRRPLGE